MKRFQAAVLAVGLLLATGAAQSKKLPYNVQFTDYSGKSWDLYKLLGEGKSVLAHASFAG